MTGGMYEIISRKRDGRRARRGTRSPSSSPATSSGEIPDDQVAAWLMAVYIRGLNDARDWPTSPEIMLASGDRISLDDLPGHEDRQAQHRRRRRQDQLRRRSARRRLRRARAHALRPRPGPHRRHPGQARGHPGHERLPDSSGQFRQRAGRDRHGHLRPDRRDRAGRQEALRAARRHGHGQQHPAHRLLDHEQEAGPGDRRHRPRRQDRQRRLHDGRSGLPGACAGPWSPSARRPDAPRSGIISSHGPAARPRRGQQPGDRSESVRGAQGAGPGRRHGGDLRPGLSACCGRRDRSWRLALRRCEMFQRGHRLGPGPRRVPPLHRRPGRRPAGLRRSFPAARPPRSGRNSWRPALGLHRAPSTRSRWAWPPSTPAPAAAARRTPSRHGAGFVFHANDRRPRREGPAAA
ncbi:MAG: hypothetical protein M0C28_45575 [Candidatus Moduliflexus flocculans]|nr:hypothetical protein [Candidatus Moduliflexus flocculans]